MQFAERYRPGPDLEQRLVVEVASLAARHPAGFAVRLHVLGDFYSVDYVQLWARLIEDYPALHVFGFTARWDRHLDPIAAALCDLVLARSDRFCIRFSNAPVERWATSTIEHPYGAPVGSIVCPQETGRTKCCSTCALCWQTDKRICFLHH